MDTEALKQAFAEIDRDSNGFLDPQELAHLMHAVDKEISDDEIQAIIQRVDMNGDGLIDLKEFEQLMLD